jgi:predicted RNase H-like HicB family nuclease
MMEYHITITECEDGHIAHLAEYDMIGDGDTPEAALKDLAEVWEDIMTIAISGGDI